MNMLQVSQTKAELSFAEFYKDLRTKLPGNESIARVRDNAMDYFFQSGLPHRRIEEWKYTDLRAQLGDVFEPSLNGQAKASIDDEKLGKIKFELNSVVHAGETKLVFVNGMYSEKLSTVDQVGNGIEVSGLKNALEDPDDRLVKLLEGSGAEQDPKSGSSESHLESRLSEDQDKRRKLGYWSDVLVALNLGFMNDGAVIRIAHNGSSTGNAEQAIHIVNITVGADRQFVTTRNIVTVDDDAQLSLKETYISADETEFQTNSVTELFVGNNAEVDHVKLQLENDKALHLSTWIVNVGSNAVYRAFQFSAGAHLSRNQLYVNMSGESANLTINGAYLLRDKQHCDTRLVVDHAEPGCGSRELFKCVLDDQSRGVFQGKLVVRPCAQKTDGKQMAQALLLGETAEFNSKPELEIYADDVLCGHGSTSGQIDEDLLFYLKSRGIPDKQARALLITAFIGEAVEVVRNEPLRAVIMDYTSQWLSKGLD